LQYTVEVKQLPEQPIAVSRGRASMANLPVKIRELFDQFYAGFKTKGGLNIVFYPGADVAGSLRSHAVFNSTKAAMLRLPEGLWQPRSSWVPTIK
jgi:hypothetical protein